MSNMDREGPSMAGVREAVEATGGDRPDFSAQAEELGGGGSTSRDSFGDKFVVRSPLLRRVLEEIWRLAAFDTPVILVGETGTGKTRLARRLASMGLRKAGPFEVLSCAAIPESLIDGKLFGHKKGSFTGASSDQPGAFQLAHQGVLMLDDFDKLSLVAQAKILTAVEEGRVRAIGAKKDDVVDVRVVIGTTRSLEDLERHGLLLGDLRWRVDVDVVFVPPARERPEDVVAVFMQNLVSERRKDRHCLWRGKLHVHPEVFRLLVSYAWPGNMRQVANVGQSLGHLGKDFIEVSDLVRKIPGLAVISPRRTLAQLLRKERFLIVACAVAAHGGNQVSAARELGIDRSSVYRILKEGPEDTRRMESIDGQLLLRFPGIESRK